MARQVAISSVSKKVFGSELSFTFFRSKSFKRFINFGIVQIVLEFFEECRSLEPTDSVIWRNFYKSLCKLTVRELHKASKIFC